MKYLASIVIPTMFSNVDYLQDCLVTLKQLKFDKSVPNQNVEVLIICNTSQEKMDEVKINLKPVLNFSSNQTKLDIKWICMGFNTGFVGATNAGIVASEGEYVIFLNDDTQVTPFWLSELVLTQRRTKADMVASKVYLGDHKTLDSQGFGFSWRGKAEALIKNFECSLSNDKDYWLTHENFLPKTQMNEPFGPDGAAALYTKKLFNEIGMLEKDFFAYLEDVDLALRARQHGMFCAFADKAVIYHYKHATSSKFSSFKSKQDLINWWKIVTRRFVLKVWLKFCLLILVERARNLSGYIKSMR